MRPLTRWLVGMLAAVALGCGEPHAELRGHGGPVRSIVVLPDSRLAVSGGFDQASIVWDVARETAIHVLRVHEGSVNAIAALPDGRFATADAVGRVLIWRDGEAPERDWRPHEASIAGLALSHDGSRLLSASWDGTVGSIDLRTGAISRLSGHAGPVNAVAFARDGRAVSGGHDGTVRVWPDAAGGVPLVLMLPSPVNTLAAIGDEIAAGGADGILRLIGPDGNVRLELDLRSGPILAAASAEAGRLGVGTLSGAVLLIEVGTGAIASRLAGLGGPAWSLAFLGGGQELLIGGGDGVIRRWDLQTGEQIGAVAARPVRPAAALAPERGEEVFKACVACHALTTDGDLRAGPTLHGVFGRRIATAPGYPYSDALKTLDIVWSAETISRLFEIGPSRYTPGTRMPEQIVSAPDREALVRYLERATR